MTSRQPCFLDRRVSAVFSPIVSLRDQTVCQINHIFIAWSLSDSASVHINPTHFRWTSTESSEWFRNVLFLRSVRRSCYSSISQSLSFNHGASTNEDLIENRSCNCGSINHLLFSKLVLVVWRFLSLFLAEKSNIWEIFTKTLHNLHISWCYHIIWFLSEELKRGHFFKDTTANDGQSQVVGMGRSIPNYRHIDTKWLLFEYRYQIMSINTNLLF